MRSPAGLPTQACSFGVADRYAEYVRASRSRKVREASWPPSSAIDVQRMAARTFRGVRSVRLQGLQLGARKSTLNIGQRRRLIAVQHLHDPC